MKADLTIGALSERTGVAPSALRFYEAEGLIHATRSEGGQRRYTRDTLRRVSFIRVAQQVGSAPRRDPRRARIAPREPHAHREGLGAPVQLVATAIDAQIALLERLRDRLDKCIGCGCLSLRVCRLMNPDDQVAVRGPGPRYVLDE